MKLEKGVDILRGYSEAAGKFNNIVLKTLIFVILTVFAVPVMAMADVDVSETGKKKTVILAVDEMDFRDANYMMNDWTAVGIMSAKTARGTGSSLESQFMTISSGNRVTVKEEDFKGLKKVEDSMMIMDFDLVTNGLDENYDEFTEKFDFIGDIFHKNGMKTAFLGNDSAMMLVTDKEGKVDYGEYIENYDDFYDVETKAFGLLEKSDVLAISYDFEGSLHRMEFIKNMIYNMDADIYVISKYISGNASVGRNSTLKPIIYKNGTKGVLNSRTTKREALVTNIDILPTILDYYGIEYEGVMGKPLEIEKNEENPIEVVKDKFDRYINLASVKYKFNVSVIFILTVFMLLYLIRKRSFEKFSIIIYLPVMSILVSLILGKYLSKFDSTVYFYIVMSVSLIINLILKFLNRLELKWIAGAVFAVSLLEIMFVPEMAYSSFVGYNNLISGGRFFGFNNDIMGTFVGAFLITYMALRKDKPRYKQQIITIVMIPLLLIPLSGKFGSNFGGLVTATVLSLVLIYRDLLDRVNRKQKLGILAGALVLIIIAIVIMTKGTDSHIAGFAERVRLYGSEEFFYMVSRKFVQVIRNAKRMPWVLALIIQMTYLLNIYCDRNMARFLKDKVIMFIFISLVALVTNDTGVVALVYINTFIITKLLTLDSKYFRTY